MKKILPFETRKCLYLAFIIPHFNYCSETWHFCNTSAIAKLEKVNERALRFVFNEKQRPYSELLNKIGLLSHENQRLAKIVCTVFNVINNEHAPKSIKGQRPALQLTALNRGGLRHQNSGTHYLTQAEQFELLRRLKTVLEH